MESIVKKLVASLVIPLFAGAVFAIVLIQQLNYTLAASSTLVFMVWHCLVLRILRSEMFISWVYLKLF